MVRDTQKHKETTRLMLSGKKENKGKILVFRAQAFESYVGKLRKGKALKNEKKSKSLP